MSSHRNSKAWLKLLFRAASLQGEKSRHLGPSHLLRQVSPFSLINLANLLRVFGQPLRLLGVVGCFALLTLGWFHVKSAAMWDISTRIVTTVSAASYESAIAPDAIVSAFGTELATETKIGEDTEPGTSGIQLPTQLGGTTVEVNGVRAPLFYVSPSQINYLIPSDTPEGTASVVVRNGDGLVSTGTMQVKVAAPAVFAVNGYGDGVAAGNIIRVKSNGQQIYENIFQYSQTALRYVTRPIDLDPSSDTIVLVLYCSGVRHAGTANVRILIGGEQLTPLYAGAQPGLVGLDQVNVRVPRTLIGRGVVNVSVVANGATASRLVDLEIAGTAGPTPPQITGFNVSSTPGISAALAGQEIEIIGNGFVATTPTANVVKFGNAEAQVMTATVTRLKVVVPYGVETSQVSVTTPQGGTGMSSTALPIRTSVSGIVADTSKKPLKDVKVFIEGTSIEARTTAEGVFVLPDIAIPAAAANALVGVTVDASVLSVSPPYPKLNLKIPAYRNRDNQFSSTISLQQATGTGGTIGGSSFDDPNSSNSLMTGLDTFVAQTSPEETVTTITTDKFSLQVPNNVRATFPDNAVSGTIFLTPVLNGRTPVSLPRGYYSSSVAQITPFGVQLNPGAKLIFPNADRHPVGKKLLLFKYDLAKSEFVEVAGATPIVSEDGQRIETGAFDIKETTFYFAAPIAEQKTDITGRVFCCIDERNLVAEAKPVAKAVVRLRGIEASTDGNGSFLLRSVPVAQGESVKVDVSYIRAGGRVEQMESGSVQVNTNGITNIPNIYLPTETTNRPPVILYANKYSIEAGKTSLAYLLIYDQDPRQNVIATVNTGAVTWPIKLARVNSNLTDAAYALEMSPPSTVRGDFDILISASDDFSPQGTTSVNVKVSVAGVNRPPSASSQDVAIDEDTSLPVRLTATDPENNPLKYSIIRPPQNGTLSGSAPSLVYTPRANFNGTDSFTFFASDGLVNSAAATVRITVRQINDRPVLTVQSTATVSEGQPLYLEMTATDVDAGQTLSLAGRNMPTGAVLDVVSANMAEFVWTPTFAQAGTYKVSFILTDNGAPSLSDSKEVTITVVDVPSLSVPGPQTVVEGQTLLFEVLTPLGAQDNGTAVSSPDLPTGATLIYRGQSVYHFRWTPTLNQAGVYPITFRMANGGSTLSRTVQVTVLDVVRDLNKEGSDFNIMGAAGRATGDVGDATGTSVATGDLNGDGIADLVVGSPQANVTQAGGDLLDVGKVEVFYGKTGLQGTVDLLRQAPDAVITGEKAGDAFGSSVAIGDVTGDGKPDLVVGAPLADALDRKDSGKFYVLPTPLAFDPQQAERNASVTRLAVFTANGLRAGDKLGTSVAVGMIDSKTGAADVAASAPGFDYSSNLVNITDAGIVYLFWGGDKLTGNRDLGQSSANYGIYGIDAGGQLGATLAIGNFNGDDFADIAIGAPLTNTLTAKDAGAAYVVFGASNLTGTNPILPAANVAFVYGASEGDQLGTSLDLGDFNGDGLADLAVGAPGGDGPGNARANSGEVLLLFGLRSGVAKTLFVYGPGGATDTKPDGLGTRLAFGDYNGDGVADLVIGAPGYNVGSAEPTGAAYVVFGSKATLPASYDFAARLADTTILGVDAGDLLGNGAIAFGNLNGDSVTDLIIGLPKAASLNNERPDAGEVRVLMGVKR